MIELQNDNLVVSFPDVHPGAALNIGFQRTLRIPDDGRDYPLPPGLGPFPLRHIDDHPQHVPANWLDRDGVLLPMYQAEARWIMFNSQYVEEREAQYPFGVKIATGKISAITGENWRRGLSRNPQDYLVSPQQPWLDGYCVEKGIIRQFVRRESSGMAPLSLLAAGYEDIELTLSQDRTSIDFLARREPESIGRYLNQNSRAYARMLRAIRAAGFNRVGLEELGLEVRGDLVEGGFLVRPLHEVCEANPEGVDENEWSQD